MPYDMLTFLYRLAISYFQFLPCLSVVHILVENCIENPALCFSKNLERNLEKGNVKEMRCGGVISGRFPGIVNFLPVLIAHFHYPT